MKLAVIAFFLAVSSSISLWLSFLGGRLAIREGSPSDEAILYSFLYGLALAHVFTVFMPRGSLLELLSTHFARMILRSLVVVAPFWLLVAWGGSEIVRFVCKSSWEKEWIQITLVLLSASLTLICWHVMYHRENTVPQRRQ